MTAGDRLRALGDRLASVMQSYALLSVPDHPAHGGIAGTRTDDGAERDASDTELDASDDDTRQ